MIRSVLTALFCIAALAGMAQQKSTPAKPKSGPVAKPGKKYHGHAFKVIRTNPAARKIKPTDIVMVNLKGIVASKDSMLLDTYLGQPIQVPATEASLKSFLVQLKQGDSAVCSVIADSLFRNSFQRELPAGIPKGDYINFTISVLDISSQEEMKARQEEMQKLQAEKYAEANGKDSISMIKFLADLKDVKTTASGLRYVVMQSKPDGSKVVSGSKVTVKYRGTFLDGKMFDESREGQPPFTFEVGSHQVIQGWDEGLQLMREGETFKFIIPWKLAYGPGGNGPIPPFSTLVFDVTVLKID